MVGDTIEDDIEGARAVGMTPVLVDREGVYPDVDERIDDLRALPGHSVSTNVSNAGWLVWALVAVALAVGEL